MIGLYPQTLTALGLRNPYDDPLRTVTFARADHPFLDVLTCVTFLAIRESIPSGRTRYSD